MFYRYGVAIAAGLATVIVLWTTRGAVGSRVPLPRGGRLGLLVGGFVLLALGATFFAASWISPTEDMDPGFAGGVVAAFLVAVGVLAFLDAGRASRALIWSAPAAIGLLAVLTALTYLFDKVEWRFSQAAPLVVSVIFFSIPASVNGLLFLGSAEPRRDTGPAVGAVPERPAEAA